MFPGMNIRFRPPPAPTRHKFTLEEARRLWASGVFDDYQDMELIDGELIEMAADGPRTINWNARLNRWLVRTLPDELTLVPDKTLSVPPYGGPKPDFYIHDKRSVEDVDGRNVLLVIEVSDSTLEFDRSVKGALYSKGGVREYWIVDCENRRVLVHRLGEHGDYSEPTVVGFDEEITALHAPSVRLRLSTLDLPD
jgi:Uma2 family endonuclease